MKDHNTFLINRSKGGDEKAMMTLYDTYCDAMFTIACRYLNAEDAKDAMQESFIKAFSKLETYQPKYSFGSWLKRIVINQCIDVLKQKKIDFITIDKTIEHFKDEHDWTVEHIISKDKIIDSINRLKPKQQVVVKLYLIEGYDHEEISEILKIPVKTSRTLLYRGRIELKNLLKTYYHEARY